jgi:glycine/D-amino acid oxidase-like deaminating enzyme
MAATADAIVIGGGIMGLFCAWHLAEAGLGKIVLLEKRFVGAGSSGKSGAILRQHYSHRTTIGMARQSLGFYRDFRERFGQDIGFRPCPMLLVCHEGDRQALRANVAEQRALGVEVEILDAARLRQVEPRAEFPDEAIGALESDSGYVDPGRTLAAVAGLLRRRGVDLREEARVTDVLLDSEGRVRGVQTDRGGAVQTRVVINAGGPWAGFLCRRLGLALPLRVIRPQQAYFMPPPRHGGERHIFGDLLTGLYWKPEPAGWTRVGKMDYEGDEEVCDPDDYDEGVGRAFIDECRRRMSLRVPAYRDAVCWGGCGALYTVTPDAHALIGPVPEIEGLYVVSGFSGHGFKMGPAVGRGVAALVGGGDPGAFDAGFFAVDRFVAGKPVTSAYRYGILG